jgi:AcrR family transcriptional regulator
MTDQASSAKERILSYAEERFLKEGVLDLPVDDLTASLGMSKKTFYKIFPSKEAMLEELVGRVVGDVAGRITAIGEGPGNFVEKIEALMTFLGSVYRRLAIPLSSEVYRKLPHVWQRVEEFRENMIRKTFTRLLDQGIREGFLRPEINRTIFMMAYLAAIRAIIRPHVILQHDISVPDAIEQIFRIFFGGILSPEGMQVLENLQIQKPHNP